MHVTDFLVPRWLKNPHLQTFGAAVMGRKTYEVGLEYGVTDPYPHLDTYVVSTYDYSGWAGATTPTTAGTYSVYPTPDTFGDQSSPERAAYPPMLFCETKLFAPTPSG